MATGNNLYKVNHDDMLPVTKGIYAAGAMAYVQKIIDDDMTSVWNKRDLRHRSYRLRSEYH